MRRFSLLILPIMAAQLLLWCNVSAADTLTEKRIETIIQEIDELYRSETSRGGMTMEIVTPNWERTLEMSFWSEGMEKTLIRIHSPAKERGVGTLRIEDEMWNYLPKTNKVIKIPPSMMMSSWMGSDFTNDDLVKEFSLFEDYTYEAATVDNPDTSLLYIDCIPREDLPIVWGHIVIAARRSDHLPVWQRYYDEKDNLMRILEYSEYTTFDNRTIPAVMTMLPQDEDGKTVVRYTSLEFDVDLPGGTFSLRNLRTPE
ncbi:MAG: outer membrane lipoprotein-sorting protein [candidate division Zixibacteria bacterium]|nr:outer membrane lipoprotein-sorting protein [candidate division Zixibacteria bacterium]